MLYFMLKFYFYNSCESEIKVAYNHIENYNLVLSMIIKNLYLLLKSFLTYVIKSQI